jgi:hypothetical protein
MTDEHLAELWAAGKSMSEIAEARGRGESRSVVAGKIARSRARGDDRFQLRPHGRKLKPAGEAVGNQRPARSSKAGTRSYLFRSRSS